MGDGDPSSSSMRITRSLRLKRARTEELCDSKSDSHVLKVIPDNKVKEKITIEIPSYMVKVPTLYTMEFSALVHEKYYIDKTNFIQDVLFCKNWALGLFRHRNSMKTTQMKSLQTYCDQRAPPKESSCFQSLRVGINDHYGKYSVLLLSFDDVGIYDQKVTTVHCLITALRKVILNQLKSYLYTLVPQFIDYNKIEPFVERLKTNDDMVFLASVCFEMPMQFNCDVILLFDNIDVPFLQYEDTIVSAAYRTLFNDVLTNKPPYLFKLVMIGGILPHNFLKLSNIGLKMLIDTGFQSNGLGMKYFMFTEDEVKKLCHEYKYPDTALPILRSRYGGYRAFDNPNCFYNAFSIIQFVNSNPTFNDDSPLTIMWYSFHSRDVLHLTDEKEKGIEVSVVEQFVWTRLLDDENANSRTVNLEILSDFKQFSDNLETGMKFLLFGAYLTPVNITDRIKVLKIPNMEIREIFRERRNMFMSPSKNPSSFETANQCFVAGNYGGFCESLNQVLLNCSARTFINELAYHVFLLVVLSCNPIFDFRDEPETGYGYSDIVLIPKQDGDKKPVVIELAYLETKRKNHMNNLFDDKLSQVEKQLYRKNLLKGYGTMDVLILIGWNRTLHYRSHPNKTVP